MRPKYVASDEDVPSTTSIGTPIAQDCICAKLAYITAPLSRKSLGISAVFQAKYIVKTSATNSRRTRGPNHAAKYLLVHWPYRSAGNSEVTFLTHVHGSTTVHAINIEIETANRARLGFITLLTVTARLLNCNTLSTRQSFVNKAQNVTIWPTKKNHGVNAQATSNCVSDHPAPSSHDNVKMALLIMIDP